MNPTGQDGGPSGTGGSGLPGIDARPPIDSITLGDPSKCGNGVQDMNEQCDDGNKTGGDGCSIICQIPAGWSCAGWPSVCSMAGVCGDGILGATEPCDDGNQTGGDGCSADCKTVEPGYECRVPARRCVPACGDGMKIGMEQCDDGNAANDDGCSSTCQIEPGASCTGTPSVCKASICGNGAKEGNEGCDLGPLNGLFNGDGTGCSKTCTKEPICRGTTGTGATHACATACGNGNVEANEQCDDGNNDSGDGCSSTCMLETGFMCSTMNKPDTQPCAPPNTGECLQLPIKYRDFKNESVAGGHPDFFYYGATIPNPPMVTTTTHGAISFSKRYCVPNSSGPARQNDSTARCWDIAQAALDANGRPAARNATGATMCDCQFTDWSHDTNGGKVPGYTNVANGPLYILPYVAGMNGHPLYRGQAPVVTSATTFGQWWQDGTWESDGTTSGKHAVANLELTALAGGTNLYRFSSAPHTVWGGFFPIDPAANAFPIYTATGSSAGPGTARTTGAPWSEPLLCNLWPYWYTSASFGAGAGCRNDQYVFPPSFGPTIAADPGTWFGMHPNGDWIPAAQGWFHDSWFSVEARYLFAYTGPFQLQFFGDDDTFIFINGVLVVDLGGVHQRLPGKVSVDAAGNATIQEGGNIYMACTNPAGQTACPAIPAGAMVGDLVPCTGGVDPVSKQAYNATCPGGTCDCRTRTLTAAQLGLQPAAAGQPANTYEIAVFSRDGHPTESNFQLTLSGFATRQSVCIPRCGDAKQTGAEECDCGDETAPASTDPQCAGMKNKDGVYGGCTLDCKYGPYCGDGKVDMANGEQCDDGSRGNNVTYGNQGGCAPGCKYPHFCGDSMVDEAEGEQCDLGSNNGAAGMPCGSDCKVKIDI